MKNVFSIFCLFCLVFGQNILAQRLNNGWPNNSSGRIVYDAYGIGVDHTPPSSSGEVYGIQNRIVYKMDSLGNTIWARDFSQSIISFSPDSNDLTGIAVNGSRLFVQSIQEVSPDSFGDSYLSVIVLDTSGNLMNVNTYTDLVTTNNNQQLGCFPSFDSGAWFIYTNQPGIVTNMFFIKVDSLGNWASNATVPFYRIDEYINIQCVLALSDSTFRILMNSGSFNLITIPQRAVCSKINDAGQIFWSKSYADYSSTADLHYTDVSAATADSLGNVYMFGSYIKWYSTYETYECFGTKLNEYGNLINVMVFPVLSSINAYCSSAYFQDSIVYARLKILPLNSNALLQFDNSLHGQCTGPDSVVNLSVAQNIISYGSPFISGGPVFYVPGIYSGQINPPATDSFPDFCSLISDVPQIPLREKINISIYPNPAKDEFSVLSNDSGTKIQQIELYSLSGSLLEMFPAHFSLNYKVKLNHTEAGMYFLKIETDQGIVVRKLLIQ